MAKHQTVKQETWQAGTLSVTLSPFGQRFCPSTVLFKPTELLIKMNLNTF